MQGEQRAGGEWPSGKCTGSERVAVEADHGSGSSDEVIKGLHLEALRGAQAKLRDGS